MNRSKRNFEVIRLRLNKGWTPNKLADVADIDGNTVRRAEDGLYIAPSSQRAICDALEVEELFDLFPIDRQKLPGKKKEARR